jgi:hypothetical protein
MYGHSQQAVLYLLFHRHFQNGNPDPVDESALFGCREGFGCFKDRVSCDFRSALGKKTLSVSNWLINNSFHPGKPTCSQKGNQNKKMEPARPAVKNGLLWFTS